MIIDYDDDALTHEISHAIHTQDLSYFELLLSNNGVNKRLRLCRIVVGVVTSHFSLLSSYNHYGNQRIK